MNDDLRIIAEAALKEGVLLNGEWRTYGSSDESTKATRKFTSAFHPQLIIDILDNQDRLKAALNDACDLAYEGWAYASPYFQEKWNYEERIERVRRGERDT